jgi:hypothetical protein
LLSNGILTIKAPSHHSNKELKVALYCSCL